MIEALGLTREDVYSLPLTVLYRSKVINGSLQRDQMDYPEILAQLAFIHNADISGVVDKIFDSSRDFLYLCNNKKSFACLLASNFKEKIDAATDLNRLGENLTRTSLFAQDTVLIKLCETRAYDFIPLVLAGLKKAYAERRSDEREEWSQALTGATDYSVTPLIFLCQNGKKELVQLLINDLKIIYDDRPQLLRDILNCPSALGQIALTAARDKGHAEIVELLQNELNALNEQQE